MVYVKRQSCEHLFRMVSFDVRLGNLLMTLVSSLGWALRLVIRSNHLFEIGKKKGKFMLNGDLEEGVG